VRCHTCVESVYALEPLGGEGEVYPYLPFESGEEEGAAHVGEEADCGLGHGEEGAFGGYAYGRVHGEADAAAHGYAVHVGYAGFRIGSYQVVELVFEAEVGLRGGATIWACGVLLRESRNVAAGAEGFGTGAADYYDGC